MKMNQRLWYSNEARKWEEALPLGNGRIGAMVYGSVINETISLNEDTLWSGYPKNKNQNGSYRILNEARKMLLQDRPKEAQQKLAEGFFADWSESYLPLGNIKIKSYIDGNVSGYQRELLLDKAIANTCFKVDGTEYFREFLVSADFDAFIMNFRTKGKGKLSFDVEFESLLRLCDVDNDGLYKVSGICPSECLPSYLDWENPIFYSENDEEKGIGFSVVLKANCQSGIVRYTKNGIEIREADEVSVVFSVATSYSGFDRHPYLDGREYVKRSVEIAEAVPDFKTVIEKHICEYKGFYDRCGFSISNREDDRETVQRIKAMPENGMYELLFNYGRYLLISSSRSGTQATNLQGIWNKHLRAPWSSNYTVNINTQMNYWPALRCGLSEMTQPLDDLIYKLSVNGQKTAKEHYNAKGFVCHHNTDVWGMTNPVGRGNDYGAAVFSYWPFGSGWLVRSLFEKYEYTKDVSYLESFAFPIMKMAAEFYLSQLTLVNGEYIFFMTTSPENSYIKNGEVCAVSKTSTMSQTIIYELFLNCIRAMEVLNKKDDFYYELISTLKKITPFKIGKLGQVLEWDEEYKEQDVNHRHISHLYGLFPSNLIKKDSRFFNACRKSMEIRGDEGTGWSLAWKANLWARLGDGKKALELLNKQLRYVDPGAETSLMGGGTLPNMLDAHPPFQIDGNFGVTSAICEMLVQYDEDSITFLPAVPKEWDTGEFYGICCPDNISVSAVWKNNEIIHYEIKQNRKLIKKVDCNEQFGLRVIIKC